MRTLAILIVLLLCGVSACAEESSQDPTYDAYEENYHKRLDAAEAMQLSNYDLFWEYIQVEYVRLKEEDLFWETMKFDMVNQKSHTINQVIFNTILNMNFYGNDKGIEYWTTEDQHKLQQLLDHYQVPAPWSDFLKYGAPSIGELTKTAAIKIAKDTLVNTCGLRPEDVDLLFITSLFNVIDSENPQWEIEFLPTAESRKIWLMYHAVTIHARTFEILELSSPETDPGGNG